MSLWIVIPLAFVAGAVVVALLAFLVAVAAVIWLLTSIAAEKIGS